MCKNQDGVTFYLSLSVDQQHCTQCCHSKLEAVLRTIFDMPKSVLLESDCVL